MRLAILAWLSLTLAVSAQTGGFGGGMGGSTGGGGTGGGGGGGFGGGGSFSGGSGGSQGGNALNAGIEAGSLLGGFNNLQSSGGAVSTSNPFSSFYSNFYSLGLQAPQNTFGVAVFRTTTPGVGGSAFGGSSTGISGANRATNALQGATGGLGGSGNALRGATGGFGGSGSLNTSGRGVSTGAASGLGTSAGGGLGFGNTTTGFANRGAGLGGTANVGAGRVGGTGITGGGRLGGGNNLNRSPLTNTAGASAAASGLKPGVLYATQIRFPHTLTPATQVRTDLLGMIARSSSVRAPAGITVETDGQVIVLRGNVADEDESRHVESLIRLSPGVRDVRNDLQFPQQ